MLNFYTVFHIFYYNGKEIGQTSGETLCDEFKVKDTKDVFTWENLTEKYQKYGPFCPFNIWNQKRGRRISFFPYRLSIIPDIKEWKHKDLNIEMVVKYNERKMSLDEIFKWHDSEKAIQYLKERNISFGVDKPSNI